jgi:hypothetical protein
MKNLIILGSGRSGTSMTAGVLAGAGYFMGNRVLNEGRINNPYGNFEDQEINGLNERLLGQVIPGPGLLARWFHRDRPGENQRWLGRVPVGTPIPPLPELEPRMRELTGHKPFCFKDPRFSYTLPAWRPYLDDAVFLCIFREPHKTVYSIMKQLGDAPHLRGLKIDERIAAEVWTLMYRHILEIHRHRGQWLFMHYDQVLSGEGLGRLAEFAEAEISASFPKRELRKEYPARAVPEETLEVYRQLAELAGFDAGSAA